MYAIWFTSNGNKIYLKSYNPGVQTTTIIDEVLEFTQSQADTAKTWLINHGYSEQDVHIGTSPKPH